MQVKHGLQFYYCLPACSRAWLCACRKWHKPSPSTFHKTSCANHRTQHRPPRAHPHPTLIVQVLPLNHDVGSYGATISIRCLIRQHEGISFRLTQCLRKPYCADCFVSRPPSPPLEPYTHSVYLSSRRKRSETLQKRNFRYLQQVPDWEGLRFGTLESILRRTTHCP